MTKPARKPEPIRADIGTKERRARGDVRVSGVGKSERKAEVISPLQRMRNAGYICTGLHEAGKRYARHRHYAGLSGHPKSADLLATGGGTGGMSEGEAAAYHWAEYGQASKTVGKWRSRPFEALVCDDEPLEAVGRMMGETNKPQAVAVARFMVRERLCWLCDLWGIHYDRLTG
jgi:hypothetical protein